jgi:hypothetical protein
VPNIAMEDQKPLSEIRILILDDVQDTRALLGTFLRAAGASNLGIRDRQGGADNFGLFSTD